MAFPTIPTTGAGRVVTGTQADGVGTRTFPNLNTLTKNAGDLLIAICIGYTSGGTSGAMFSAWGASFTELPVGGDQGTSGQMCIGLAYKFSTGSETGTFTVTQATPTGHACFILLSIAGAHASTAPEAGTIAAGTTSAANPGSFDPGAWGAEDTLWVAVAGNGETGTGGTFDGIATAPANYSNLAATAISADAVGGVTGAVAFRQLNAASEDVGTFSLDTSNARNAALLIAVRPPPVTTQAIVIIGD